MGTGRRTTPVRYGGRSQGQCGVGKGLTSYLWVISGVTV